MPGATSQPNETKLALNDREFQGVGGKRPSPEVTKADDDDGKSRGQPRPRTEVVNSITSGTATLPPAAETIKVGTRISVRWTLAFGTDTEDTEPDEKCVWWGCSVVEELSSASKFDPPLADQGYRGGSLGTCWKLIYDTMPEVGYTDKEERHVVFVGPSLLIDAETRHEVAQQGGGSDGGIMQWRFETDESEPPELLAVGTIVKARFGNGSEYFAGQVERINYDGTYAIL